MRKDQAADGDEKPRETERGEDREVGPADAEPRPRHEKGEETEEAVEEEKGQGKGGDS